MVELVIARIGRAQGLRGEVHLAIRTDAPELRLRVGAHLETRPEKHGPVTIARVRHHGERWYVAFEGIEDRAQAETLSGVELVTKADVSDEPDAWYPHELVGLRVETCGGDLLGEVTALEHLPAHDLLAVRTPLGERVLVPFVRQIVPTVDIAAGRIEVTPPGGLFPGLGEIDLDLDSEGRPRT